MTEAKVISFIKMLFLWVLVGVQFFGRMIPLLNSMFTANPFGAEPIRSRAQQEEEE